ncbi:transglycosylase domain-containing protein [Pseudarthrobacter niigatensis]|uniref:Membrane peptidoglycan carboxypeptidase n=1 Tax=Pseudarthrobacter niigatensis TaxID=369935 RepID=A0AAJ1WGX3_9MICC|nr:transglycosylase domain-containing protein [Pseudarthrobacter niigatensis]MDQ0145948.1 membrane peptidoglycan carboxypeptidase [Pseudarthrobacter niigatensis]MDQ0266324.1 membrane peptidoglycan carboxypeptidase [Pseudarthrobacter niigatensis]
MPRSRNLFRATGITLGWFLGFIGVSALCGALVAGLMVPAAALTETAVSGGSAALTTDLPNDVFSAPPAQMTRVLAADGSLIATLFDENRTRIPLDQMSPNIKNAIVAVEDYRFYQHGGIDPEGIFRALAVDAAGGHQGASTLTQQYVTNMLNENLIAQGKDAQVVLNGQKGVNQKIQEMKLAIGLEEKYSKDQILAGYLNVVGFNANAYGIQAASQYFFSVDAKDLTLPQGALLAGLVNGPSLYDPTVHPEAAKSRRDLVLDAMLQHGYIDQQQHDDAVGTPIQLKVNPPKQGCAYASQAQYFCDYVLHQIENDPAYGATLDERDQKIMAGGLTIKTTLDPRLQGPAQAQVDATAGANPDKWGASLVTIEPGTGKVLSMAQNSRKLPDQGAGFVSDYNFNVDSADAAGNSLGGVGGMQPGSTMKPVTLAAWLGEGKSTNQVVDASKRRYGIYYPWKTTCQPVHGWFDSTVPQSSDLQNDEPNWYRPMTVREGIYQSINTATFASLAGLDDFCDVQRAGDAIGLHLGSGSGEKIDLSTLGNILGSQNVAPLTMANAFATFDANGTYCAPMSITEVDDSQGNKIGGQTSSCRADALKPDVAKAVTNVLQDVLTKGSGLLIPQKLGVPDAAKTGTNEYNNQTWVVGYTKGLATASFFGDPFNGGPTRLGRNITVNGKFYPAVDGAFIAGPQWAQYMQSAVGLYDHGNFDAPPQNLISAPGTASQPTPSKKN